MKNIPEADERALWLCFKQGDAEAFAELYRRYARPLYHYGYRLTQDAAQTQDATQDLFVELWQRRAHLADVTQVKPYLLRSLRRRLHLLSQRAERQPTIDPDLYESMLPPVEETPVTEENFGLTVQHLKQQLARLPRREFEALHLYFYENLAYAEVAAVMEINEQSARNTVGRGLFRLRQHLSKLRDLLVSLLLLAVI